MTITITKVPQVPVITSQYNVCPIPFRLDTYSGCTFGCKYCFARDTIQHIRRVHKLEQTSFNYLKGMDAENLKKWIKSTLEKNSDNISRIAFRERIPVKIGGVADPFPYVERGEKITYTALKILNELDYPVQITTKNPEILAEYCGDFITDDKLPNWAISVTIISPNEEFRQKIEPYAPSIDNRFASIKKITDKGIPVMVKIQPVFYPYIMSELENLISKIKESGAYAIEMEGLKIKVAMDKKEQLIYQEISSYLGYDIRQWYKDNGKKTKSDYELKTNDKLKYIEYAKELCEKYDLKFFAGDNDCRKCGCSGECCGTEILRNYKTIYQSDKLLDCSDSFTRTGKKSKIKKTIREKLKDSIVCE